jgi:hypothetical protein
MLSLLWLPSGLVGLALLTGAWLSAPELAIPRTLLLMLIALHTLAVVAAWFWVGWRRLARSRGGLEQDDGAGSAVTLAQLQALSPAEFERWVGDRFQRQGYYVRNRADRADHGVDLWLATPDGQVAVVQCKRYEGTVGEPVVRDLYGVMQHEKAALGFLVTTGRVSAAARRWAQGKPMVLLDGQQLIAMTQDEERTPAAGVWTDGQPA